jgi:flagellar motor protein MotB
MTREPRGGRFYALNSGTTSFGKRRPENLESTEEGRARNRRVEIRLSLPAPPAGK